MDKLKVNFVSQGNSYLASHRMRIQTPVELLNVGINDHKIEATITSEATKADINVFAKHFDQKTNLMGMQMAKKREYFTVFDICDDHFDKENGPYYKKMCTLADVLTCNTDRMQKRIEEVMGREVVVIPDPVTFPFVDPEVPEEKTKETIPQILWFGHATNLKPLQDLVETKKFPYRVTAVTNAIPWTHPNVDLKTWFPNVVEANIKNFDVVILPTDSDDPYIKTKSPNRAVDAIASGKFVVTDNKDIYGDLKDFIFIGGIEEGIKYWQKTSSKTLENKIKKGQKFIKEVYGLDKITDAWLGIFKTLELVESFEPEDMNHGN